MQTPNIFLLTTWSHPDAVRDLLLRNGYDNVPKNYKEVSRLLAEYVSRHGEKAFNEMLPLHPDFQAFSDYFKANTNATGIKEPNGEFLNCAGCPFAKKLSADAVAQPPVNKDVSEKVTNALIIGGSVVLASIMVTIIVTTVINAKRS
ncbi:MAG: hypothetical protein PHT07_15225 [Paludibacter sp.]|nr:hypothetical protein [Paludibacter sp.]